MARLVLQGGFEGPGEIIAARRLEAELPDSWLVVCNKEVPSGGSSREIDLIVVGSNTVFVLEEKHLRGTIRGNTQSWVLDSGESRPSPLNQVKSAAAKLNGFLKRVVPESAGLSPPPFPRKCVLLTSEATLEVDDYRVEESVVFLGQVVEWLISEDLASSGRSMLGFRDAIVEALVGLPDQPAIPQEIGPYKVAEVEAQVGDVLTLRAASFRGRADSKVIRRPVTLDAQELDKWREAMLREFETLRLLAETGVAPAVQDYFSWDQDQYWVVPTGRSRGSDSGGRYDTGQAVG